MNPREVEILGVLAETPSHVYRLEKLLAARHGAEHSGELYRVIKSLERRGLVRHSSTLSGKGPERRVYSLTEEGEGLLAAISRAGAALTLGECLREIAAQVLPHIADDEDLPAVRRILFIPTLFSAGEREIYAMLGRKLGRKARERYVLEVVEGPCLEGYIPVSGDATGIPFEDATFDLVLAPALCFGDLSGPVGECARVLVPGGTLVTVLPFSRDSVEQSLLAASLAGRVAAQFPQVRIRSHLELVRALDRHFSVASVPHQGGSAFICRKETA